MSSDRLVQNYLDICTQGVLRGVNPTIMIWNSLQWEGRHDPATALFKERPKHIVDLP